MGIRQVTTSALLYPRQQEMVNKSLPCVMDDTIDPSLQVSPGVFGLVYLAQESHKGLEIVGEMLHVGGVITWASIIKEGNSGHVNADAKEYGWSTVRGIQEAGQVPNIQFHSHGSMSAFFSGEDTGDIEAKLDSAIDGLPSGEMYFVVVGSYGCEWIVRKYVWKDKEIRYNQGHVKYGPIVLDKTFGAKASTTSYGTYTQGGLGYTERKVGGTDVVKYVAPTTTTTKAIAPKSPRFRSSRRYSLYTNDLLAAAEALVEAEKTGDSHKEEEVFVSVLKTSGAFAITALGHAYKDDPTINGLVKVVVLSAEIVKEEVEREWAVLCRVYFEGDPLGALDHLDNAGYAMMVALAERARSRNTNLLYNLISGGSDCNACFPDIALSISCAITQEEIDDIVSAGLVIDESSDLIDEYNAWTLDSKLGPSVFINGDPGSIDPWLLESARAMRVEDQVAMGAIAETCCDGANGISLVTLFKLVGAKTEAGDAIHRAANKQPKKKSPAFRVAAHTEKIVGLCSASKPMEMADMVLALGKLNYEEYIEVHNAIVTSKDASLIMNFAKNLFLEETGGVSFIYVAWMIAYAISAGSSKPGRPEASALFDEIVALDAEADIAVEYNKWALDHGFPATMTLRTIFDVSEYTIETEVTGGADATVDGERA